jgi:hypothetical protein
MRGLSAAARKSPLGSARLIRSDGPDQRLFWIDEFSLRFGQGYSDVPMV